MREPRKWFSVDSKSFEISVEGEGRSLKGYITERRKGVVSWVRFGGEGLRNLLKGVEICCKEGGNSKRIFDWKENGRFYMLESHKNDAGKYLSCLVTDGEGKRHKIFIPEGRGLIKGWVLLVAKLIELGIKGKTEERRDAVGNKELLATQERRVIEDENDGSLFPGKSFVEVTKAERSHSPNMIWVDVGECLPREAMKTLKFCLVGRWENPPDTCPTDLELEAWARTTWRLKGSLMVAFLNQDLLFMEFDIPEEAKWVFELGRRWFRGGSLNLEWWTPNFGCAKSKEEVKEAWIRVVGLPLHLWTARF